MSATTTSAGQRTKSPTRHAHKHEDPPDFSCKELAVFMNCMTASQFNEIRTFFQNNCGRPDDWVRFLKNTDMTLDDSKDQIYIVTIEVTLRTGLEYTAWESGNSDIEVPEDLCAPHADLIQRESDAWGPRYAERAAQREKAKASKKE